MQTRPALIFHLCWLKHKKNRPLSDNSRWEPGKPRLECVDGQHPPSKTPGHAGVKGNDRADTLAGKATLTSGLLLGRSEVLRSLRHYLRSQSQGHHTIDRLEERGVERGSARRSSLKGRQRAIVSQTSIGTVSKATLGKLLRDGVERIRALSLSLSLSLRAHRYHLELNFVPWTGACLR